MRTHLVTHAHPDHFGSSHAVCEALGLPLWTGAGDADALETATPVPAQGRVPALLAKMKMPPGHPVARRLREGDEVAGFVVLDVPGHSPGHIALWRESDRTLVCGDVFFNMPSPAPAAEASSRSTRSSTARRCAAWPSCGRRSCCSATARRCAIPIAWRASRPAERPDPRPPARGRP